MLWPAAGGGYDLGAGLQACVDLFPPFVDLAGMGGVSTAVPRPSSANPAGLSFLEGHWALATAHSWLDFPRGPDARVEVEHLLVPLRGGGLRLTYLRVDSSTHADRLGWHTSVDLQALRLYAGRRWGRLSLGLSVEPWSDGRVRKRLGPWRVRADLETQLGLTAGAMLRLTRGLWVGGRWRYLQHNLHLRGPVRRDLDTYDRTGRIGLSWEPRAGTLAALDWAFGEIRGLQEQDVDAVCLGVEQRLGRRLALRMGYLDGGFSAGMHLRIGPLLLDYAWLSDALRDLRPAFGRGEVHMVGVGLALR